MTREAPNPARSRPATPAPDPRARPWWAGWPMWFVALSALWGTSFLFIKVAVQAMAPLQVTLGRMFLGVLALALILALRREGLPKSPRVWGHLVVASLILNVVPFSLYAYGEQHVSSVLAGILNATTPLLTLLVTLAALPEERPTRARTAGLSLGFVGVLVVLGVWHGVGGRHLAGSLMCLGAAGCYALGLPYARRFLSGTGHSVVALSAGQLLAGTVVLMIMTPMLTSAPRELTGTAVASVVVLGVLGTGVAYLLNYSLVVHAGATTASSVTYLIPVFSTAAGVLFLSEPLTWNQPVGALVVLVGVAISQGLLRRRAPERHQPEAQDAVA